jgi:hypothetical protein
MMFRFDEDVGPLPYRPSELNPAALRVDLALDTGEAVQRLAIYTRRNRDEDRLNTWTDPLTLVYRAVTERSVRVVFNGSLFEC